MNYEAVALEVAKEMFYAETLMPVEVLPEFLRRCLAKIGGGLEPKAWWNGKETAFFEHETDGPVGECSIPLYATPHEAIIAAEQRVAEACAKACDKNKSDSWNDDRKAQSKLDASDIRSGEWRKYK